MRHVQAAPLALMLVGACTGGTEQGSGGTDILATDSPSSPAGVETVGLTETLDGLTGRPPVGTDPAMAPSSSPVDGASPFESDPPVVEPDRDTDGLSSPVEPGSATASSTDDGATLFDPTIGEPVPAANDLSLIVGLYDGTFDNDGARDVTFFEVRADGVLIEYDFRGDEQAIAEGGPGRNCHDLFETSITPRGANRYSLEGGLTLTAIPNGRTLDVTIVDGDGDVFESVWRPVDGLSPIDLEACTEIGML